MKRSEVFYKSASYRDFESGQNEGVKFIFSSSELIYYNIPFFDLRDITLFLFCELKQISISFQAILWIEKHFI